MRLITPSMVIHAFVPIFQRHLAYYAALTYHILNRILLSFAIHSLQVTELPSYFSLDLLAFP